MRPFKKDSQLRRKIGTPTLLISRAASHQPDLIYMANETNRDVVPTPKLLQSHS